MVFTEQRNFRNLNDSSEERISDSTFDTLLDKFELNNTRCAGVIRDFARSEPERFLTYGWGYLRKREFSETLRFLGTTLIRNEDLPRLVVELICQSREDAIDVLGKLMRCDPFFELKIIEVLRSSGFRAGVENAVVSQAIDVLDAASPGTSALPWMRQLQLDPDPRIQAKAAMLIGKRTQNLEWVKRHLKSDNSRVRANVVESLNGVPSETAREVLWNAVFDGSNRVAGNALLALYQLGDNSALPNIFQMAECPDSRFRSTGAWVMGATGDARFTNLLASLLRDPERAVRTNALRSLQRIKTASKAASNSPQLEISVVKFSQAEDGAHVALTVLDSEKNPVANISRTSWILTEDNNCVREYSVDEFDSQRPLSVAFLTAEAAEVNEFRDATAGIVHCLPLRHPDDRWAILKLKPVSMESAWSPVVDASHNSQLKLKQAAKPSKAIAPETWVNFSRSPSEIQRMLSSVTKDAGNSTAEAIRNGSHEVLAARLLPGERQHLICIGTEGLEGLLESAALRARDCRFSVHIVTLPGGGPDAALRTMVESTGGHFMVAPDAASIPQFCETLYRALRHHYHLRWVGTPRCLKVRLHSKAGQAIAHWPDTAPSTAENCDTDGV